MKIDRTESRGYPLVQAADFFEGRRKLRGFADLTTAKAEAMRIATQAMLTLPVPDWRGSEPMVFSAPCSPELKQIVASLVDRAEASRTGPRGPARG